MPMVIVPTLLLSALIATVVVLVSAVIADECVRYHYDHKRPQSSADNLAETRDLPNPRDSSPSNRQKQ